MAYDFAVIGATGTVGRDILAQLSESGVPVGAVAALASSRSIGREVSYGEDDILPVHAVEGFDFSTVAVALFAVEDTFAKVAVPLAVKAGCLAVDTSAYYRLEPGVPLVVMEVNAEALDPLPKRGIVAVPSALGAILAKVLTPLDERFGLRRTVVSTYQSTASAGREGMDELFRQTRGIYVNEPASANRAIFPKQIAFNVIPQVEAFEDNGGTHAENAVPLELRKIVDPDLAVHTNCARVPGFVGSAAWLNVETEAAISEKEARTCLRGAAGLSVVDHRVEEGYVTPVECGGEDLVYVSRLRRDHSVENGLSLWCVADDMRVGVALNAVAVAQRLLDLKRGQSS